MKAQSTSDNVALFKTLRSVMKANGYTYGRLAREIGVSEVTIKRLFSSRKASLERLLEICEQIGVSFLDVAALAKTDEEVDYFLTPAQEKYFSEIPTHFAVLKDLNRGVSVREINEEWNFTPTQSFKVLRALEKLGFIDILGDHRVRMKIRGNIRMSHRGALAKKVLRPQTLSFLDHIDRDLENDDVCLHSAETELSENHIKEFAEEIHALGSKYRAQAFRDRTLLRRDKLKSVRWLFAFAPYKTDWRRY